MNDARRYFLHSQDHGQGHGSLGGPEVVKYSPTPDRLAPTGPMEANEGLHIVSRSDAPQCVM